MLSKLFVADIYSIAPEVSVLHWTEPPQSGHQKARIFRSIKIGTVECAVNRPLDRS